MGQLDVNAIVVASAGAVVSAVASVAAWAVTTAMHRLIAAIEKLGERVTTVETSAAVLKQRVDGHDREFEVVHGRLERAGA